MKEYGVYVFLHNFIVEVSWLPKKNIDSSLVDDCLQNCISSNQWVNGGQFSSQLEGLFKSIAGISDDFDVIYTNSATSALHLAFRLIKHLFPDFHNVLTSAFTFPSVVQSGIFTPLINDLGDNFQPILSDHLDTVNVVTNLFGSINDLNLHKDHFVVYDNSASPLGFYNNRSIHEYGFCSVVSLHHTKMIGFGEGGFLIINKMHASLARRFLNFGFSPNDRTHHSLGSNFKGSEISAIYSLQFLNQLHGFSLSVIQNHQYYHSILNSTLQNHATNILPGCYFYIHETPLSSSQAAVKKYYKPLMSLPNSLDLFNRILCFPVHQDINHASIDYLVDQSNCV